jgi:hypothetical protein
VAPFETAIRDAAKLRMDQMKTVFERMQNIRDMMESMSGCAQ